MRALRTLGLLLIACGLFVQSAANASAPLRIVDAGETACAEMKMLAGAASKDDRRPAPCKNLRLDCLVALGCIAPLAPGGDAPLVREMPAQANQFSGLVSKSLAATGLGPEPPPPQLQA
ncbi:MAG: hypothetical protein CMO43_13885 [Verrucomicrobiales bacterium]|nr:hypothetical protein [Verrucomicrobiales bacterium]